MLKIKTPPTNSSHYSYNDIATGEPLAEYARFGSVFVNFDRAIFILAFLLTIKPDTKIDGRAKIDSAINYGLRLLIQFALDSDTIPKIDPTKTPLAHSALVEYFGNDYGIPKTETAPETTVTVIDPKTETAPDTKIVTIDAKTAPKQQRKQRS